MYTPGINSHWFSLILSMQGSESRQEKEKAASKLPRIQSGQHATHFVVNERGLPMVMHFMVHKLNYNPESKKANNVQKPKGQCGCATL